jgi:GTPase SAR1 family protein
MWIIPIMSLSTRVLRLFDGHMLPMQGTRRAIIINEVDNIHRDVQDCLHDWLQDELPKNYIVIVTTNKMPCSREQWDKMTKSEKDEHLTPKFGGRFMWFEIPNLSPEEIAKELVRMCKIPEKAALVCARNGNGDIRHTLKEVQKAIRIHKIKKRKEQYVTV